MPGLMRRFRTTMAATLVVGTALLGPAARGDTVILKDGTVLKGTVDRDNVLVFVNDNLKRTIFYNSRIAKVVSDPGFSQQERFALDQPLLVHGGAMPPAAIDIQATPWDAFGRRMFRYTNARQSVISMKQAINELGPRLTRFRGIDGFWQGQVATSEVPRPTVTKLLNMVKQDDESERTKVIRWLIQAEWYPEARSALDAVEQDFPGLKSMAADVRRSIDELEARDALLEIATTRKAQQPAAVAARLRSIGRGVPRDVLDDTAAQIRDDDARGTADRALADSLRDVAGRLAEGDRKAWKPELAEVLEALAIAPDAVRDRLEPFAKLDPGSPPEARFALAMASWIVGPAEISTPSLADASALWSARASARKYLSGREPEPDAQALKDYEKAAGKKAPPRPRVEAAAARADALVELTRLEADGKFDVPTLARIVGKMAPPLDPGPDRPSGVVLHRVGEDDSIEPTEYAVLLPPEYHPLRSYPAVVALHDGHGPRSAINWVAAEAARRGYIVVAPEYNLPGKGKGYHYSSSEHAAVELSLRDARKRYAIDSDRVYLAGQLIGGEMAIDLGLGHPDLFAGVVSISGMPGKYAYKYKGQLDHLPLYLALGEFAPAAREFVFDQYVKPMIEDVKDVTYIDYLRRGLEELPEDVPTFFDWMDKRKRDAVPRTFDADTAREGDNRFYGVIVQSFVNGRSTSPEAADPLGKNLRPAHIKFRTSTQGNLLNITTSGIARFDVWVSPRLIDFSKKMEVRVNEKPMYKGLARLELGPVLEDLRIRGDRQQIYFFKVTPGMNPAAPKPKGR